MAGYSLRRPARQRGVGMVEYVVVSGVLLLAMLTPFGADRQNVLQRLRDAMQHEHAGYMYAASLPMLPDAKGSYSAGAGPERGGDSPSGEAPGGPSPEPPDSPGGSGGGGSDPGSSPGGGGTQPGGEGGGPGAAPGDGGSAGDGSSGPSGDGEAGGGDGDVEEPGHTPGDDDSAAGAEDGPGNGAPQECSIDGQEDDPFGTGGGAGGFPSGASQPTGVAMTHVGNPIQVVTGNKYQREVDLELPGGFTFARHYNSRSSFRGSLGRNWRHGYETTLTDGGNTVRLWQGDGRRIDFRFTHRDDYGVRHYRAVQHRDGRLTRDDLWRWHWPDGRLLTFSRAGRLHSLSDAAGQVIRLSHGKRGEIERISHPDGRRIHLRYDDGGRLSSVTDPAGATVRYGYDASGRLSAVHYPDRSTRRYRYDDARYRHHLTSIDFDSSGGTTRLAEWAYDEKGRAISSRHPDGSGNVRIAYAEGETQVTDASGRSSFYATAERGGIPHVTAVRGPGCGGCDGGDVRYAYNADWQVERIARRDGTSLEHRYDGHRRLARLIHHGASGEVRFVARFSYAGDSNLPETLATPSIKPGAERVVSVRYDAAQRPIEVLEQGFAPRPDGTYQPVSRRRSPDTSDDLGLDVLAVDANRRPARIKAEGVAPIDLSYDARGRLATASRGARELRFSYDAHGRLSGLSRGDSGSIEPFAPTLGDRADDATALIGSNVNAITDGKGNTTRYGVDDFGRRVFTLSPDTGLTTYEYDEAGNLRRKTVAGGAAAEFDYDAHSRLTAARLADGKTTFKWGRARVDAVESPGNVEQFEYDDAGRLVRRLSRLGAHSYAVAYRYHDDGRLRDKTLPDGRKLRYRYGDDDEKRLDAILEVRDFQRDLPLIVGLASAGDWRAFNGIETTQHREQGRLRRLAIGDLHDFSYFYSPRGHITGIDDGREIFARYRFDAAGRLDLALTPDALVGFHYDGNGNRVRLVENGRHIEYEYAASSNRILSATPKPPDWHPPLVPAVETVLFDAAANEAVAARHNADGSLKQLGRLQLRYNANGQVEEIWNKGRKLADYRYNSRTQRVAKLTYSANGAAATVHYIYEDDLLIAEASADGRILAQYLYRGGQPVALLAADRIYAIHNNHLGAPIAMTDEGRRLVWRASYAPFGRATVDEDPDGDGEHVTLNLRLPGQYEDIETGLHYNHHRYYDPDLGRYLSSDPLGLAGGLNTYTYAANDPVNNIDPTGLLLFAFDGTGNTDDATVYDGNTVKFSNVYKFRESYRGDSQELGVPGPDGKESDRHYYYITGPGTEDRRTNIGNNWDSNTADAATGASMIDRIEALTRDFFDYVQWMHYNTPINPGLNIDIVGFSRGAAAARVFANLLDSFLDGEDYFVLDRHTGRRFNFAGNVDAEFARVYIESGCARFALRFLGLWDTVPHYGGFQDDDLQELELGIPDRVDYAAHAVAVNENRADFHGVSIHADSNVANTERRMELGFIGAHSDIGGGYPEGDLSEVALAWMVRRAEAARGGIVNGMEKKWKVISEPVVHDSLGVFPFYSSGRNVKYMDGREVPQRTWTGQGMNYQLSRDENFYDGRYTTCTRPGDRRDCARADDKDDEPTKVGEIRVAGAGTYQEWLARNYGLYVEIQHVEGDE